MNQSPPPKQDQKLSVLPVVWIANLATMLYIGYLCYIGTISLQNLSHQSSYFLLGFAGISLLGAIQLKLKVSKIQKQFPSSQPVENQIGQIFTLNILAMVFLESSFLLAGVVYSAQQDQNAAAGFGCITLLTYLWAFPRSHVSLKRNRD